MTAREFLEIESNDIDLLMSAVVAKNSICSVVCDSFYDLTFGEVGELRQLYSSGNIIGVICKLTGQDEKKILSVDYKEFVYFLKWVTNEFLYISNLESQLQSEPDAKLLSAGIEEMDRFGDLNIIDRLAKGKVWDWHKVEKTPYKKIFVKLLKDKTEAEINKRYVKLINAK